MANDNSGLIASALEKTAPALAQSVDARGSFQDAARVRGARVQIFRDYVNGDHRADITQDMKEMLRIDGDDTAQMNQFNDNYCAIVVNKMASRLHVGEFNTKEEAAQAFISETIERNKYPAIEGKMFRGAVRDGDSYILTAEKVIDEEKGISDIIWQSEPAYNGFSGIYAVFDIQTQQPVWACKLWSDADVQDIPEIGEEDDQIVKVTAYTKDSIHYFAGLANGDEVTPMVGEDGKPAVEQWNASALPVVHFVNQADNYTGFGESELKIAIPLQDVLNRTLHSMVMASELAAFKIYWSIGIAIDKSGITPGSVINLILKDSNGEAVTQITEAQAEFLKAVKVGEFGETDITQYTNQIDQLVREISQVTETPIYGVTTQGNLSGEALKQLEIGLIGKVERFQRENEDAVKHLIKLTAELRNKHITNTPKVEDLSLMWKPAEIIDVGAKVAVLVGLRKDAQGLFTDKFYRAKIGQLLEMTSADIKEQNELMQASAVANQLLFSGAGGTVPEGLI